MYKNISEFNFVKNPVLTTGTFDGVHLGHLKIISRLNEIANKENGQSVALTFFPHPRMVLYPNDNELQLLSTLEEKIDLLEKAGIQHLIIHPFDKHFSKLTSLEFVRDILVNQIKIKTLVIGYNHQFGRNREGSYEHLKEFGPLYGFDVEEIPDTWDRLMEGYIGLKPKDANEGWAQDMHWAHGMFGYFPSYLVGNMVAAQLYYALRRSRRNLDEELRQGNFTLLVRFLAGHFSPSETSCYRDANTFYVPVRHRLFCGLFQDAPKRLPLLQTLSNHICDNRRLRFWRTHLFYVEANRAARRSRYCPYNLFYLLCELCAPLAATTDNKSRARGSYENSNVLRVEFNLNRRDIVAAQSFAQKTPYCGIRHNVLAKLPRCFRKPSRFPVADDAESVGVWMNYVCHKI